ncbi:MAG: sensor histidine kinase, partial [Bacteriovorax sp.]
DIKVTKQNCEIRVIDSGKGVPLEIQDKLFSPFFTTKPVGDGTGLGLSICKKIIENHKGKIYIDNKCPNTCFVVSIKI